MNSVTEFLQKKYKGKTLHELFVELKDIKDLPSNDKDKQIIKLGMIAELDASNFYESLAELATNSKLKKVLLDIAKEEVVHFGEFKGMIDLINKDFSSDTEEGKKEVKEI